MRTPGPSEEKDNHTARISGFWKGTLLGKFMNRLFGSATFWAFVVIGGPIIFPFCLLPFDKYLDKYLDRNRPMIHFEMASYQDGQIQGISDYLLPLFKLDDVPVRIENEKTCSHDNRISAYTDGKAITLCEHTAHYEPERLTRVLKHELIHVWIIRNGIKDNAEHGTEFMKKAIEVGTLPLDEDVNPSGGSDR